MFKKILIITIVLLFSVVTVYAQEYETVKISTEPEASMVFASEKGITYDLNELEPNGIHALFIRENNSVQSFIFGVDERKVDRFLRNTSFLIEEDYLKDGKIPVIISLNTEQFKKEMGIASFESPFDAAKTEVVSILQGKKEFAIMENPVKADLQIIDAISVDMSLEKLNILANSTAVKKVHLDRKVNITLTDSVPLINATKVWTLTNSSGHNITGLGATIAIIDTGVDYTHPDLGGCLGSSCKVVGGYDFVNQDSNPMDDHGHGTHVAATAAGNGTLKGVAPDAKIYAYKVLSSGGWGYWSWVISGIQRATDPNNDGDYSDHVKIISMSLGGWGNEDDAVSQAVDTAVARGVIVIVAAGNSGTSANAIGTPASARKAITIAATDKSDNIAWFSSRGPSPKNNIKPDLVAPGVSICAAQWDAWLVSRQCYDNRHISISGTSMATPHVSGAAALLLQLHPDWNPDIIKSVLMSTAKDLGTTVWAQGTGRIDVYKASQAAIAIYPQSVSIGQISDPNVTREIKIQNLNSSTITVNITAGLTIDSSGSQYNISYIINSTGNNISSVAISPNTNVSVNITINIGNLEGTFYGYINISSGNDLYRIPYAFIKKSKITVNVIDLQGGSTPRPVWIMLHNDTLSYVKYASQWWDFYGNSYTFNVPSGSYSAHAIGDWNNFSLTYILTGNTSVSAGGSVEYNLSLSNARLFNVTAYDINNNTLDLYKWQYLIEHKVGSRWTSGSMTFIGFGFHGDRLVYMMNTENDTGVNISLSYVAYPWRNNTFSEWTYGWADETFDTADELYLMGWVLKGINSSTPTLLNYTLSELTVYNYTYGYPGTDPHVGATTPRYSYNGIIFWMSPASFFDFSGWYDFTPPLKRKVYLKGDGFGYWNYMYINYLHTDTLGGDWRSEFAAAIGQVEEDRAINFIWPYGVQMPTSSRELYHGSALYLPTYFRNTNTQINISSFILKGYTNETYVKRYNSVTWCSWDGTCGTIYFEKPVISIYNSAGSLISNTTSSSYWTSFSYWATGQYTVNITIPSAYPLSNQTIITAKFNTSLTDKDPPRLMSWNVTPRFELNKNFSTSFNLSDDYGINNVSAFYSYNQGGWSELTLINQSNQFNFTINVTDATATQLNLKIYASDTSGNYVNYTILPIAMLAHNISLNFTASKTTANQGDTIIFTGRVIDTTDNKNISGVRLIYALNNSYQGHDRSESYDTWSYNTYRSWHRVYKGEFETAWTIPSNYPSSAVNFSVIFNGTGIYLPNTTNIQITINVSAPTYSNLVINPPSPTVNDNVQINSTWSSADKVLFVSNYSGSSVEYATTNFSSVYNYTISASSLSSGAVITYRFRANNTAGVWNNSMPTYTFTVQSISTNISIGQTVISVSVNQNTTLWCDYVQINATDVTGATVNAEIDSSNQTMAYNSTSGRYEYKYNATGSTGIKTWKCYASKSSYQLQTATSSFTVMAETESPTFSNVVRTSDPIYTNTLVEMNSTWSDNDGLSLILFSSNFSGSWRNYTAVNNPSNPQVANYIIVANTLNSSQVVGWKYLANDTSNNWNNLMPIQAFTVQNRIPQIVLNSYDNNKGWGEIWSFVYNVTDADNDTLNVNLWSKLGDDWIFEQTQTTNSTTQQVNFSSRFLNSSYVGTSQIKGNVTDSKGGTNETSNQSITVEKDDVNVTVTQGINGTVQRYGYNTITIGVTIYDFDSEQYVNSTSGEIYLTKDGSTPYDVFKTCDTNVYGNCSASVDPDDTYDVGTQYFWGGTTASDISYKAVNSSQSNFTVLGALFTSVDSPSGAFNASRIIYLNTSITDDTTNSISVDTSNVYLEYRRSIGTAEWSRCSNVTEATGGKYFCPLDTTNLTVGYYDIRYMASKANYTDANTTVMHQFKIIRTYTFTGRANFTAYQKNIINATVANTTLEIVSNGTFLNVDINVTFNTSNPTAVNLSVLEIGRYLTVNVSDILQNNLSYSIIKVNYTDEEVNSSGIIESSLRLYRFNGTSWLAYDNHSSDYQGDVNIVENYVWGNVTMFSDFGLGGKKDNGQACTANTECNSDNCAADYDEEGKWCAPSGNCAHDYSVTLYTNSYTLCSDSNTKQTCSSGSWTSENCGYGCSSGTCSSAPSAGVTTGNGGGAGGLATTTGKITKSFTSITTFTPKTIDEATLKDSNTKLTEIYIAVKERVLNVKITVEKLSAKPASIAQDIFGKVYEYMDISNENLPDSVVESAKIKFKVSQSWITNNSIDKSKVYLYRYADNKWNQLTTSKVSEDTNYVYYETVTPGFSTFVIAGEQIVTVTTTPVPTPIPTTTTTTISTPILPLPVPAIPNMVYILVAIITISVIIVLLKRRVPKRKKKYRKRISKDETKRI